jgi:hypothetical protein
VSAFCTNEIIAKDSFFSKFRPVRYSIQLMNGVDRSTLRRTFTTTLRKTNKPVSRKKINSKKPVIVVRRIIDARGQHETTKVDIKSDALCDLILHINRDMESSEFTKAQPEVRRHVLINVTRD